VRRLAKPSRLRKSWLPGRVGDPSYGVPEDRRTPFRCVPLAKGSRLLDGSCQGRRAQPRAGRREGLRLGPPACSRTFAAVQRATSLDQHEQGSADGEVIASVGGVAACPTRGTMRPASPRVHLPPCDQPFGASQAGPAYAVESVTDARTLASSATARTFTSSAAHTRCLIIALRLPVTGRYIAVISRRSTTGCYDDGP